MEDKYKHKIITIPNSSAGSSASAAFCPSRYSASQEQVDVELKFLQYPLSNIMEGIA